MTAASRSCQTTQLGVPGNTKPSGSSEACWKKSSSAASPQHGAMRRAASSGWTRSPAGLAITSESCATKRSPACGFLHCSMSRTNLKGRVPVVLNVNGHDSKGKAAPYKQIRCINLAKRGMLALNLEWLGMGQLQGDGFSHNRMNQLDLCGTSGLAVFYLAMQRASTCSSIIRMPTSNAWRWPAFPAAAGKRFFSVRSIAA